MHFGPGGRFPRSHLPRCRVFVSKQTYWSLPCLLIRVNLFGRVRQLLHWKLSHQFKDRRWRGVIYVGPSMCSMNSFCFASPRIYKLDDIQANTFIFLLFIQGMMFWCSSREQEQSVHPLHTISITLPLLWLYWAFGPEGFIDASWPACFADSQRPCMLDSLFPEGLPFLLPHVLMVMLFYTLYPSGELETTTWLAYLGVATRRVGRNINTFYFI